MNAARALRALPLCAAFACAAPGGSISLEVAKAVEGQPLVIIIKSANNPQFDVLVENFVAQVPASVETVSLEHGPERQVARLVEARQPAAVYTLGSRATLFAKENLPKTPIVFSMVVNHAHLGVKESSNVAGIALELPPEFEFSQFKMVAPNLRVVTVFYNPESSSDLLANAVNAAATIGITLKPVKISSTTELAAVFDASTADAQAVWLQPDPIVMNEAAFRFLRQATMRTQKLLLASFSDKLARAGAAVALSVDLGSMGAQAAAMTAELIGAKRSPREMGVVPPIGGQLYVNTGVANAIHHVVPDDALPYFEAVGVEQLSAAP